MKRLLCALLAVCLLCITAFADIAWEPENSFYKRNYRKCEPENRMYLVNGAEGYVTVREEPEGKPLVNVKNGMKYHVYGTYTKDGETWGLVNYKVANEKGAYLAVSPEVEPGWTEAWIPMTDMVLKYDHQSFLEDHPGEVREVEQTADFRNLLYCRYLYPGSELEYQQTKKYDHEVGISLLYVDDEGREWGYTRYFHGDDGWFCLDDPENPGLQTENHTPDLYPLPEGVGTTLPEWTAPPNHTVLYAAVGVLAVCGVTAALLVRIKRRKDKE